MFEENQYDFANQWKSNHISHFNWTPYIESAVLRNFFGYGSISDIFFTNADETTASESVIVNVGGKEQKGWRTLSKAEWKYLFDVRKVKGNRWIGYSYSYGLYQSSSASTSLEAYCVGFLGDTVKPDDYTGFRSFGYCVRLITEVE